MQPLVGPQLETLPQQAPTPHQHLPQLLPTPPRLPILDQQEIGRKMYFLNFWQEW